MAIKLNLVTNNPKIKSVNVKALGSRKVSLSMKPITMIKDIKNIHKNNSKSILNFHAKTQYKIGVNISTTRYLIGIGLQQFLQKPFKINHEATGILSKNLIGFLQ